MCTESCSIWCNTLTVYVVRLTALAVTHEYACLSVRGYKTTETKMTAHLKKMCGRYVAMYAKQLSRMERLQSQLGSLTDKLRLHFPDTSDEIMNSQWPQACENSDRHTWALVQLGETVTKTCCGTPCTHDWEPTTTEEVSSHWISRLDSAM
jgi:hypothetical protein